MKIIRNSSIGSYSWDTSGSSLNTGSGSNQWGASGSYTGSDLMRLLNTGLYYNRTSGTCYVGKTNATKSCNFTSTGLTEEAKNMIGDAKWYTAAIYGNNLNYTTSTLYGVERGSTVGVSDIGMTITKTISWTGKIGITYLSDYGYASDGCRNGEQTLSYYSNETCTSTNWMYDSTSMLWTISALRMSGQETGRYRVAYINSNGSVYGRSTYDAVGIKPTVYLKPEIEIISGDGTKDNPYNLSL